MALLLFYSLVRKTSKHDDAIDFFSRDRNANIEKYYQQNFSNIGIPYYLIEGLWYSLIEKLTLEEMNLTEDYFLQHPNLMFDFNFSITSNQKNKINNMFWSEIATKMNIQLNELIEFNKECTFKELVAFLMPKLKPRLKILVVCNSSTWPVVIAKVLINYLSKNRIEGFNVCDQETIEINPFISTTLEFNKLPIDDVYKKQGWNDFAETPIDLIIGIGDQTAEGAMPFFLKNVVRLNWVLTDPSKIIGTEQEVSEAFDAAFYILSERIKQLVMIPFEQMTPLEFNRAILRLGSDF